MSSGGKRDLAAVRRADNGRCCVGHIGNRPFFNGAAVKAIGRIPRRGKRPVFIRDTVAVIDCSVSVGFAVKVILTVFSPANR